MSNVGNLNTSLLNGGGVVLFESDFDNGLSLNNTVKFEGDIKDYESIVFFLHSSKTAGNAYALRFVPGLNAGTVWKNLNADDVHPLIIGGTNNCAVDMFRISLSITGANNSFLELSGIFGTQVLFKTDGTFAITKYDTSAWRVCKVIGYKK